MSDYVPVVCPYCDEEFEMEDFNDLEMIEFRITFDELMEHMFTELVKLGHAPTFDAICDVVAVYNSFIRKKVEEMDEDDS